MKIKYKSTLEDIIAFSIYHNSQSLSLAEGNRKHINQMKLLYLTIAVLGFSLALLVAFLLNNLFIGCVAVTSFVFGVLFILGHDPGLSSLSENNLRSFYTEKPEYEYDDVDDLELTDEGVKTKSEFSEALFGYECFSEICSNDDYYFVYLRNVNALVIHRNSIIEGDVDAFIKELQKRLDANEE